MANTPAAAVFASIEEREAKCAEAALYEIKSLKKDLTVMEKILSGKQKKLSVTPHDIVHGAQEIFRQATAVIEYREFSRELENDLGQAKDHDFLEKHGASLLKKPAGWHWISPTNEMHFLGKPGEADKAAQKLSNLLSPKKRKAPARK